MKKRGLPMSDCESVRKKKLCWPSQQIPTLARSPSKSDPNHPNEKGTPITFPPSAWLVGLLPFPCQQEARDRATKLKREKMEFPKFLPLSLPARKGATKS